MSNTHYEPLHHKYRPQTFEELVGQEAIATTLTNAVLSNRIAPAYLFTGPRGTGKTSSARILAKSLNCLSSNTPTPHPCGQCDVCKGINQGRTLDVIEIDAASNTGVDNIRELIERARFAPVQCRYKVYVIDECHMLSTAAFNALLKTLEEPPNNVVFVLATTDQERVLPTIISRCQRFDYRRIPVDAMVQHLEKIAAIESINISQEAITLVAQLSNGGLRDAESLLDQLSLLSGTVTPERIWDLVGSVSEVDLMELIRAIATDNPEQVLDKCRHLLNRGREPLVILQNLANFYLYLLVAKTSPHRKDLVTVTHNTWEEMCEDVRTWELGTILQGQQSLKESELQIKNTTQPRLWLEITLLGLIPSAISSTPTVAKTPPPPIEKPPEKSPEKPIEKSVPIATISPETKPTTVEVPVNNEQVWQKVLKHLEPTTKSMLEVNACLKSFEGNIAQIGVSAGLFKLIKGKQIEVEKAFAEVMQRIVRVQIIANPTTSNSVPTTKIATEPPKTEIKPPPPKVETREVKPPAAKVEVTSKKSVPPKHEDNLATTSTPAISKSQLWNIAQNVAKEFDGQVIVLGEMPIIESVVIQGRPDLSNISEDDLDF